MSAPAISPAHPDHAAALFPLMADPALSAYLTWAPHQSEGETRALLEALAKAHAEETAAHWTVLDDGAPAGLVSLIDMRRTHRLWRIDRAELAYWIGRPHQGRGLARAAAALALAEAFGRYRLNKVIIGCATENRASVRVAEALGAGLIGEEQRAFQKANVWRDMMWFEILKPGMTP